VSRQPPDILARIHSILSTDADRRTKASRLAHLIQSLGPYRWVGLYDVTPDLVSVLAHTGDPPARPTFPVTQGLTSAAVRERRTILVNDVRTDPRYLTAFGSTLAEIIVPILHPDETHVIGTIDVESAHQNAFTTQDQHLLESCARAAAPLWTPITE
jgi:putative methionine-R-sulfoxide reductase with GAF domain